MASKEIEHHLQSEKILHALFAQLEKDFSLPEGTFEQIPSHSFTSICEKVQILLEKSTTNVPQVLYIVDVDQGMTRNAQAKGAFDTALLAQLIVKRELQKVVTRQLFSGI